MKKINLSITRCTNPKCKRGIIAETIMKKCPICNSELVKDKQYTVQGLAGIEDGCIVLKDKGRKSDSNRYRNFKK